MPRQKRALSRVEPNTKSNIPNPQEAPSAKRQATVTRGTEETSSSNDTASNAPSSESNEINAAVPRFIAVPRPNWDIDAEARDDEDEESESNDGDDAEAPDTLRNQAKNVPDVDSPEWPWIMSSSALDQYNALEKQAENRDQDLQQVYVYNDFTAYGINEVLDNWLKDFNKEVSRRVKSPYAVWARLEALSWFLQLDFIQIWFHGDDCHGFAETIALIGKALLTGVTILKTNQLFTPYRPEAGGSGIRNISTVLALFVQFARTWTSIGGDHYGETKWVSKVGKVAKENGIDIKGPYNFHQIAEAMLKPEPPREEGKPKPKKQVIRFSDGTFGIPYVVEIDSDEDEMAIRDSGDYSVAGWKAAFKDYSKKHGKGVNSTIGGSSYDITRFTKAEKKKYGLDSEARIEF
ncbi:hypothetical protein TMatcc_008014 [Talaromyces marneffei ATCC 18224]|uniref:Uncharacterized protein n=1 Tax=Talaromyces marneffei (strain ATCC 18224 / CBS 334.59 / QM 7333) TaxID=441960 RepID=B6QE67_TALMQ|nr:uncharacterized protein EYB26_004918 [Talaromyces marneffei]EEA24912.1 hypothetical protein PMAA_088830 [Talaromyces marneffei ATCC 18224]KAE8552615.1 hypothetical protein EYB25_003994 [Talaromyces marneffei]QGA17248.1 hypothetical protein EYB26_004918 [Talaromyces marneffei]